MKPGHKYSANPAPYALIVANPKGGKRRNKKRRNPAKRRGIFVIRKPKRNPSTKVSVMKTRRRRHRAKRRNPAKLRHVLMLNPRKRRRSKRRGRSLFTRNPMKKHRRRRGARRSRNPVSRRSAPRRMGRRSRRRFRNPLPGVVQDLFGPDMLTFAGGVVVANVGTSMIMNRLVAGNAQGQRPFDLPGVDYSMLGTANAAQFYSKNAWLLALYKIAIGGSAGYLLRNQSPRLSRGILVGTVATAISDVLKNTGVLSATGALTWPGASGTHRYFAGTGRNYSPRLGFVPGTPTTFTGPAQSFLTANNVPRPRGMGARVGPSTMTGVQENSEGAFRGAN